jgi:hypothetical protein
MQSLSRRGVLQGAAAFTTTVSVGAVAPSGAFAEENSGVKLSSLAQIDAILRTATDAKEVRRKARADARPPGPIQRNTQHGVPRRA